MKEEGKDFNNKDDLQTMTLRLDKIFSYEEIYKLANKNCEIS